jgi:serine/threonine-protein kinase
MQTLGRYALRREIGRGAMGIVYEAYDNVLERVVALKTINAGMLDREERRETLERFAREAKAAARITHPAIVTIFDFGVEGDTAYIVMELLEAVSLKQRLRDVGRIGLDETDRILTQLLSALGAAHKSGIVHRDIKPSNIMVLATGQIKVADFGIARIEASSTLTQTGTALGTPSYMSPEQLRGLPVDGRADLFSAGVVLYEMLAGQRPFEGETTVAMYKVLHETPTPLSKLDLRLSPQIDAVVGKALCKETGERFADVAEFLAAWQAARSAPLQPVQSVVGDAPTLIVKSAPPAPAASKRASPYLVLGGMLLGLTLLGLGGWYVLAQRPPASTPPAASA